MGVRTLAAMVALQLVLIICNLFITPLSIWLIILPAIITLGSFILLSILIVLGLLFFAIYALIIFILALVFRLIFD